ncbi:Zn-dependent hydrolase [Candidatus Pacearchaeota archaeon]|nr:Zn-dependent hydrolase [Candidatus Pacearchaeota archaeon]|tara:strand:+ start:477 stop:1142 length:666 start_codon:yes stop_codon:yes gene_type:complete
MKINDIEIKWLGHAGFLIENPKKIYVDPYKISDDCEKADLILITHSHYDHCSIQDLEKIIQEGTTIVMPADCQSKIARFNVPVKFVVIEAGQELVLGNMSITAFPAYNIDKDFHLKDEGWLSYLIKINDVLIYHTGDTDVIPEMHKLTGHKHADKRFVALFSVGGRFTMNAEEAVEAAKLIKPDIAIPMHYGIVVGDERDAKEFCELCRENNINSKILEKE